jgi:hypothetical protein
MKATIITTLIISLAFFLIWKLESFELMVEIALVIITVNILRLNYLQERNL